MAGTVVETTAGVANAVFANVVATIVEVAVVGFTTAAPVSIGAAPVAFGGNKHQTDK